MSYVEWVVDDTGELGRLAIYHFYGLRFLNIRRTPRAQHLNCRPNGGKRITKLVGEHGQKFVFPMVGIIQFVSQGFAFGDVDDNVERAKNLSIRADQQAAGRRARCAWSRPRARQYEAT
jgi:hypothetical protein